MRYRKLVFQDQLVLQNVKYGIRANFVNNFQLDCDNFTLLKFLTKTGNKPTYITCKQSKTWRRCEIFEFVWKLKTGS
jgi:hypothetical protein